MTFLLPKSHFYISLWSIKAVHAFEYLPFYIIYMAPLSTFTTDIDGVQFSVIEPSQFRKRRRSPSVDLGACDDGGSRVKHIKTGNDEDSTDCAYDASEKSTALTANTSLGFYSHYPMRSPPLSPVHSPDWSSPSSTNSFFFSSQWQQGTDESIYALFAEEEYKQRQSPSPDHSRSTTPAGSVVLSQEMQIEEPCVRTTSTVSRSSAMPAPREMLLQILHCLHTLNASDVEWSKEFDEIQSLLCRIRTRRLDRDKREDVHERERKVERGVD